MSPNVVDELTLIPIRKFERAHCKRVVFAILVGACLVGCGRGGGGAQVNVTDDGVTVDAPGVHIQTGPNGAQVNAPGVRIDARDDGEAHVSTPGVEIHANERGANVAAPGARVEAGPNGAKVDVPAELEVGK